MHAIGPYEFTEQDVETTVRLGRTLFDLLPGGIPVDPLGPAAPFRDRAERALDDPTAASDEVLGVLWGEWRSAMHALREAGAYGPEATGSVVGLFVGDGGTPKSPRDRIEVTFTGVDGDRQADRANHGRPWQAVCIWSAEVIEAFASAGHPLAPGRAGENVTLQGIPWDRVVPGSQLRLGDVLVEVTSYAVPCKKNARWFVDGRFDAMHHRHGPVSRMYATVLEPGAVVVGDAAVLEPGA